MATTEVEGLPTGSATLSVLMDAADAVASAVFATPAWGRPGDRPGQYVVDQVADRAATSVLLDAGLGVLSEESGCIDWHRRVRVALDPLDGSANAVRGVGPFGVSLCAVDHAGPLAATVLDLTSGSCHTAIRGRGAWCDGARIEVSGCTAAAEAVVALSGHPPHPPAGCTRSLGAAAIELCGVADASFDAFVHHGPDHHGVWDYLAGVLICQEAGGVSEDAGGRDLVAMDPRARRAPLVAATPDLLGELRATMGSGRAGAWLERGGTNGPALG